MNGDNSNASTNARWKVLNCHVKIHNDQVHFCISVPVFPLDVGTCLFRGVSSVFGKWKNATASDRIAQWTMGTFSVDAKDAGKGERLSHDT